MEKAAEGARGNQIKITIEDKDIATSQVEIHVDAHTRLNIERGPQTPAEEIAAVLLTYLQTTVLNEKTPQDDHPTIITPDDYGGFGGMFN